VLDSATNHVIINSSKRLIWSQNNAYLYRNRLFRNGLWRLDIGVLIMNTLQTALNKTLPILLTDLESAMANAKTGQEYLDLQTLYLFLCEQETQTQITES
jgi:hypothetical protein